MGETGNQDTDAVRLDMWLWRARFYKSRALAAKAVKSRKIRIDRCGQIQRITKPHFLVRPDDLLIFMRGETLMQIEVLGIGTRRGPAPEAQGLYRAANTPGGHSADTEAKRPLTA